MTDKFKKIGDELKTEYFGIDNQIDDILRAFETWETTKEFINKPLILSVVGTTGNGKSSVINKIVKKLDIEDKKVYLKFNNRTTDIVKELKECKDSGMVVIMDEFQYLRTINEHGEEIKADKGDGFSILFDLFDDGNIVLQNSDQYHGFRGYLMIYSLDEFIKHGVTYSNGIFYHDHLFDILNGLKINIEPTKNVSKIKKLFSSGFFSGNENIDYSSLYEEVSTDDDDDEDYDDPNGLDYDIEDEKMMQDHGKSMDHVGDYYYSKTEQTIEFFLPSRMDDLYSWVIDRCNIPFENEHRLRDFLFNIKSIGELSNFLKGCFETKPRPTIKDFHNSLIITISNLDEAYHGLTSQVGADGDLDADYYNKESEKITILKIRKALLKRFRAEQVARFGSRWVIYPILGKKDFKAIINKELINFRNSVICKFDSNNEIATITDVKFTSKIHDLIYAEGVFPTLGARCTFATVSEIVAEKFASIIQSLIEFDGKYKNIVIEFDYNRRKKIIDLKYLDGNNNLIKIETFKYLVKIDNLRSENKKLIGRQAHRGSHEAGHTVASVIISKIIPEVVYSTLMESGDAVTRFNADDFYMPTIDNYINDIAVSLGGYAAEKMIFGNDKVSSGSSSDLQHATQSLSNLFKECGFGGKLGRYVSSQSTDNTMFRDGNYCLTDGDYEFDSLIQNKIDEAMLMVTNVLLEQKVLLLKMTEYLIKQPKMSGKKVKDLTKKYAVNFDVKELEVNKVKFYLDMINNELNNIKNVKLVGLSEK